MLMRNFSKSHSNGNFFSIVIKSSVHFIRIEKLGRTIADYLTDVTKKLTLVIIHDTK